MLSRVAEHLYWLGRYVERAENTARIVNVNAHLLLDLPKGIAPGWEPLIAITGGEALYRDHYRDYEERSVVRFLVADPGNPGSILSSLAVARENARAVRDFMPRELWELLNELYYYARDNLSAGVSKRGRYGYLKHIVRGSQTMVGLLVGTMSHDAGEEFLRIGRVLERADMTTRIIDVRSESLLPEAESGGLRPFENIQWVSVLKSLTAYQMYRRKVQSRVRRADALRFLLQDEAFPRAFYRCVCIVHEGVSRLPRCESAQRALGRLQRGVQGAPIVELTESNEALHGFIDQLQVGLAQVHEEIERTYFLVDPGLLESPQLQAMA
jgi:uncharacterized alpha-E superfamily protein